MKMATAKESSPASTLTSSTPSTPTTSARRRRRRSDELFVVRELPGKGQGVIAITDIRVRFLIKKLLFSVLGLPYREKKTFLNEVVRFIWCVICDLRLCKK